MSNRVGRGGMVNRIAASFKNADGLGDGVVEFWRE
jgi:hypothetical protein